jgi:uncharacterized protein YndB with AHSA1/START domain
VSDNTTAHDRLGTLLETSDGWELRYVRHIDKPPATAWRAFVEPDIVARWFPTSIAGELVVGASLEFDIKDFKAEPFGGEVLEVEEPHLLVFSWGPDVLRFELADIGGGSTELTMTILLTEYGRAARDAAGWHVCLDHLAGLFADDANVVETETWAAIHPSYVEHFGPEAATIGPPQAYCDAQQGSRIGGA